MWFFRPDHRQLQCLYLTSLKGAKLPSPHQDLVHSIHFSLWRELQPKPQAPWLVTLFHIFIFLAPVPSFLGLFIWVLGQKSTSGASTEASFWGSKEGNLEDTFLHSDSVFNTFPLLALSSHLHPTHSHLGAHKTARAFCSGLPQQWDGPHICADPSDPWPVHPSVEKNGTHLDGIFSSFRLLFIPSR